MASWDYPAVAAPTTANYAAPLQDFSTFKPVDDFVKGRQQGREEDKARAFRNGIPRDSNGDPDYNKISDTAARVGGIDYALPLLNLQVQRQSGAAGANDIQGAASIAAGSQPPSAQPAPQVPSAAPRPPVASSPKVWGDQEAQDAGIYDKPGGAPVKVASNSPSAPLGAPVATPAAAPQPTQVAQAAAAPDPNAQQADRYAAAQAFMRAKAASVAAFNPKLAETYNKTADDYGTKEKQLREQAAPTNNRKDYEYAVAHGFKGSPDEWAAQAEGDKATYGERAKADVKEQQEYISAGKQAGSRLTTLNTIGNIVNSDKNLTLGFGADTALKVKMALQQLGVPVGDLSGAEGIQKMNASLASEMAKSLSGRPTQFEFKSFMANNPGLLLDKSGNQRLIGIYSQLAKREYELGKLARQNADNWSNWDNVVEKFDKKYPIVDPISKQPISTNSVIAPGPKKDAAGASAPTAPPQEGAMAINPKTGERLKLQGGKWVPFA